MHTPACATERNRCAGVGAEDQRPGRRLEQADDANGEHVPAATRRPEAPAGEDGRPR